MILSERERRILAEIQQQLAATDPRFARAMRRGASDGACSRAGCAAVTVLAGLSALLCAALLLIGPAIVAALLAAAAQYLRMQLPRRSQHPPDRSRWAWL
jgi:hypothetical protein